MKKPRNRVLIPLDGSQFSLEILPAVKQFLDPRSSELTLLHVTEMPNWLPSDEVAEGDTVAYPEQEAVALEASQDSERAVAGLLANSRANRRSMPVRPTAV